jgi:hypothetical protein
VNFVVVRGPRTRWGKILSVAYGLAVGFSLAALLVTAVALSLWPFITEQVPFASDLFQGFGLLGGTLIQVPLVFLSILILPVATLVVLRLVFRYADGDSILLIFAQIVGFSFIEAWAVSSLLSSFMDFFRDFMIIHFVLVDDIFNALWFNGGYAFITDMDVPIFFVTFCILIVARLSLYFRKPES